MALVIANAVYANGGNLRNPVNDAHLVADALRADGFDSVELDANVDRVAFEKALRDFKQVSSAADIALVYYAGHGVESGGANYMIPVDAQLKREDDLRIEAIDLERIMDAIKYARVRIAILDACRDNPFSRGWTRTTRAAAPSGLAVSQLDDYLVIYAAAAGQTASDGPGGNSPFAISLAKRLDQPDLPIQLLGNAVRDDVMIATGGSQRPFVSASITSTLVFLNAPGVTIPTGGAGGAVDPATLDALAWQGALRANTSEAYADYRAQFPQGRFVKLAAANMKHLGPERIVAAPGDSATRAMTLPGEDAGQTAHLNQGIAAYNDSVARKHQADLDDYKKQVDELAKVSATLQDEYLKKIDDFKAKTEDYKVAEQKWKDRVAACRKNKVSKCAESLDDDRKQEAVARAGAARLDPVWNEALTLCKAPSDAAVRESLCEGPMGSGSAVIGTAEGAALLSRTCGHAIAVRDLGVAGGMHVFGCGFALHPADADASPKEQATARAEAALGDVAGRMTFHCPRKTSGICQSS